MRSLHLYASAILESLVTPPPAPKDSWRELMDRMADYSCDVYRSYIRDKQDFVRYFRQATPEQELGSLPLGSRPSKRVPNGGIDSLRAIPWIFAWSQNRLVVPSWLGLGQSIEHFYQQESALIKEMYNQWPYFRSRMSLTEMVYLKSDTQISNLYDETLVEPALKPIGDGLRDQVVKDEKTLLEVLAQSHTLEKIRGILRRLN